ncbi:hypothetical protein LTR27_001478 [Elasticomyces elasticus]|nr:hypothetical protein LTR27_001478 [Elasticomyces elasticus]
MADCNNLPDHQRLQRGSARSNTFTLLKRDISMITRRAPIPHHLHGSLRISAHQRPQSARRGARAPSKDL